MRTSRIAVISIASAVALGMVAGPASAAPGKPKKNKSITTVQFTKSTKTKLKKDGILIRAESPARKLNAVTFTMPVKASTPDLLENKGALIFARADRGVYMGSISLDLSAASADYVQEDGTVVEDAFDIGNLKVTKKSTRGHLNVAMGKAAMFNEQLSSNVFRDGMFVAKFNAKPQVT